MHKCTSENFVGTLETIHLMDKKMSTYSMTHRNFLKYNINGYLYSGRAQPRTSKVIPVDAKNARDTSL